MVSGKGSGMSEALRNNISADLSKIFKNMPDEGMATMEEISEAVAEETGIPLDVLMKRSRSRLTTGARHYCFYKMYEHGYSYPEIALFFDMNHTSVIYGADKVRDKLGKKRSLKKRGKISPIKISKSNDPLSRMAAQVNAAMNRRYE